MGPEELFDHNERDGMLFRHTPLIKFIDNRISIRLPPHINIKDLIHAGVLSLMDAGDKYDTNRETLFKTYAQFRIRGAAHSEIWG